MGWQWPAMRSGTLNTTVQGPVTCLQESFWRRSPWLPLPLPQFGLRSNYREGKQPCPSTENWIKGLLSTAPTIRARSRFPSNQSLPSGSFHKPFILIHQRADRMETTITENWPNWPLGSQPCLTQWNYESCFLGSPNMDGSWPRVLTKCGPLEKGIASQFSILALRTPWEHYEKAKRYDTERWTPRYATRDEWRNNSRKKEELEPNPKQCPVVDMTGDGSKVWCCNEQYCIGTWNVRSLIQGKLEVIQQEKARVNIDILGISELNGWI